MSNRTSNVSNTLTRYERVAETDVPPNSDGQNQIALANNEIALDSLPYIDNVHPDYEAYALSLIEEEMQSMKNPIDNLTIEDSDTTPTTFLTSAVGLNKVEYESLVTRHGQPRSRGTDEIVDYMQQIRNKSAPPSDVSNPDEWKESIKRAKIELEYERLRLVNAELQAEYESSLWKHHTESMEAFSTRIKSKLEKQQLEVDKVNAKRKEMQEEHAAPKLMALNARWEELIRKSQHLAKAVKGLEDEVVGYREITGMVPRMEESDDNL